VRLDIFIFDSQFGHFALAVEVNYVLLSDETNHSIQLPFYPTEGARS
jgi:hypothetical protein